jgi:hypothetical protein
VEDLKDFVSQCDVVTVNCPLHEGTRGLVNTELLKHFKKGAWLVNTARGAICDKDAVAEAIKNGQLNGMFFTSPIRCASLIVSVGYSGDVWNVQPAPKEHPWRYMKNPLGGGNGMVPHYSGTTLDAQARYAAGTKSILENYLNNRPQEPQNVIIGKSEYSVGRAKLDWLTLLCRGLRDQGIRPAVSGVFGQWFLCWFHMMDIPGHKLECIIIVTCQSNCIYTTLHCGLEGEDGTRPTLR